MVKMLSTLIVPGGFLLLAAVVFLQSAALESLSRLVRISPYVVFGVGVLLGWRFNRSRIVFALLVLALADRALLRFAGGQVAAAGVGGIVFNAVALLLPLNLAVLAFMTERGTLTLRGTLRLSLILLQVLVVGLLCLPEHAGVAGLLEHTFVDWHFVRRSPVAQPALLVFGMAFVLLMIRFIRHQTAIESGFVWGLVAAFLALRAARGGFTSTVYLATAGLILVISVIETSYMMAYRDELTGLPARRALNEALLKLGSRYTVAMVDVDHFKKFNDLYGHDIGDQLLRMVGSKLARLSGGGKAFRYGGEEFAVIFPDKSAEDAIPHLEALRKTIQASSFSLRGRDRPRKKPQKPRATRTDRKEVSVTISIGVAESDGRQKGPDQVVKAADKALYRAKKAGRNQVKT